VHALDEVLQHFFGDFEVGDDAILQGADGRDVAGRPAEHALGVHAHSNHRLGCAGSTNGDHRGLVKHDTALRHINQRVGGTEVDSEIGGEHPKKAFKQHE